APQCAKHDTRRTLVQLESIFHPETRFTVDNKRVIAPVPCSPNVLSEPPPRIKRPRNFLEPGRPGCTHSPSSLLRAERLASDPTPAARTSSSSSSSSSARKPITI